MNDDEYHDLLRDLGCVFAVLLCALWVYAIAVLIKMLLA